MTKIFIDGSAGTTGLRIRERLENRPGLDILTLPEELRKDPEARRVALNSADIAFLCLPDAAAREAVALVDNPDTVIIDTSTAHRTADGWTYGFPELVGKDAIKNAKRIANPGCHASGFVALVAPLVKAGLIDKSLKLTCFSLTGYSGGGKPMIADYQSDTRDPLLSAPRQYGLSQTHKHLPEMAKVCGLDFDPIFCPIVGDFYSGMEVTVPLFGSDLKGTIENVKSVYYNTYVGRLVTFNHQADEGGFLSAAALSGSDGMQLTVTGNEERLLLTARFDNLGKGASGAAIQNMNILLGVDETTGLSI